MAKVIAEWTAKQGESSIECRMVAGDWTKHTVQGAVVKYVGYYLEWLWPNAMGDMRWVSLPDELPAFIDMANAMASGDFKWLK